MGKEWHPILKRSKTRKQRALKGNCNNDTERLSPEGLVNHRRYAHKVASWLGHVRGHMSKVFQSWAVGASRSWSTAFRHTETKPVDSDSYPISRRLYQKDHAQFRM